MIIVTRMHSSRVHTTPFKVIFRGVCQGAGVCPGEGRCVPRGVCVQGEVSAHGVLRVLLVGSNASNDM